MADLQKTQNNSPKYIKQRNCACCGWKHTIIVPTEKNIRQAKAYAEDCVLRGEQYPEIILTDETQVFICRNVACELFQNFMPDGLWGYKKND